MGGLASSRFLIYSTAIAIVTILSGIGIVAMNIHVGRKTWVDNRNNNRNDNRNNSSVGQIDTILRLQVCFYDLLMGSYLILIVIASGVILIKGDYCDFDTAWRSSIACSSFGVVFAVSSHGSLLIIAVMSIVRFLVCIRNVAFHIPVKCIYVISTIIMLCNVLHAVAPVLPIHHVRNLFRSEIYLIKTDNPFLESFKGDAMEAHVRMMHQFYYSNSSSPDLPLVLTDLANITSDPDGFDFMDIGYYGSNPLCISNIFKNQSHYKVYKAVYPRPHNKTGSILMFGCVAKERHTASAKEEERATALP